MYIGLNENWKLSCKEGTELFASLPCSNYLALIKDGKLADPFYGKNEEKSLWPALLDWTFEKSFTVDGVFLKDEKIFLRFDRLDTLAEIYLNGSLLARTANCHTAYEFEAGPLLKAGVNRLSVIIRSPVNYIRGKQNDCPMPKNMNGLSGVPYIRKPQCHFGWDWGPVLPPSGIGGAALISYNKGRIADVKITRRHEEGKVTLGFHIATDDFSHYDKKITVKVTAPDNTEYIVNYPETDSLTIDDPLLWWANGLGDQPLYSVETELKANGKSLDINRKKIGLRTVRLIRQNDGWGQDFRFEINGVSVFAKGANWIPPDSFIERCSPEVLEYYVRAIAEANMNFVRVWGGGYYESEVFYDLCDRYGILVWQDFAFACAPYPFYDEEFLNNVKAEVEYNVKRLRHRASLALYCGNNEIEAMAGAWTHRSKLIKWTENFFYNILPAQVAALDGATAYIAGSPAGVSSMNGINSDRVGDTHLWQVWHGMRSLTYYRKRFTRFCSEFGLESLPSMDAVRSFTDEENLSLTSDVFLAHQKCLGGNQKMLYYMAAKYNVPRRFDDLIYLTGLIQKECVADATEHWRRNTGRCNGSLYWQLNDCWPVSSWASIDYTGKYKPLQYAAKHFNRPVMVSIKNEGARMEIYAVNDLTAPLCLTLKTLCEDFYGRPLYGEETSFTVEAVSAKKIAEVNCLKFAGKKKLKNSVFIAELYENGKLISRKTALFAAEKNLSLPRNALTSSVTASMGTAYISIKAPAFARAVTADIAGVRAPLSDNCFDLRAGEERTITVKTDLPAEELARRLTVKDVANVKSDHSKFNNFSLRAKIFLTPVNFINWLVRHFL